MIKHVLVAVAVALMAASAAAQTTTVDWSNFSPDPTTQNAILFRDATGTPLSQGVATQNTDGFLVQLGYFSLGTPGSNFAGVWIPLTGALNTGRTAIGDSSNLSGSGNGVITFNTFFRPDSTAVDVYDPDFDAGYYVTQSAVMITNSTPANGQVLAIRFFGSTDENGNYNTVSADNWLWASPSTTGGGLVNINLATNLNGSGGAPLLEFEDAANPFLTTIPEPSTYALLTLGAIGLAGYRRFKKR